MIDNLSRRTFLEGTAAVAVGGAAVASALAADEVMAWAAGEGDAAAASGTVRQAPSLCNGCSSKCGLVGTTVDGKLWTVEGAKDHPYSKGTICGRGHGVVQMAYNDERLTQPLKRAEDGTFAPISWDDACREIAEKVNAIIAESGPEALCLIHDPRPSGKYYGPRFLNALGSANVYTHGAACNASKESGITYAVGASNFSVDFGKAKMVMFIGRSYGDAIRPSSVQSLASAADAAKRIVVVDPRLSNSAIFATDWVPIKPGTDIALLMAMANVLIEEDLYDHDFVENYSIGFPEFAAQAVACTPEWAEEICEVPADTIRELAQAMAKAAPAAAVEPSWRAAFGCSYANSFDTARAVCAVNALLGSWGQEGGALLTSSPKAGDIDKTRFPSVPKPQAKRVGDAEYPLVLSGMGSNLAALQAALDGTMRGFFFYNSNAAQGYANPKVWREGLGKADLVVTIDVQMSETAVLSHYVLPECTYIERMELPEFIGGKKHYVGLRTPIIDRVHPDTRSCDEIFTQLAQACGVGEYFDFTLEELAAAQLESVGTTLEEVRTAGTVELADPGFACGVPKFKTESGKFEFSNAKVGEAGLNPVIGYVPRLVEAQGDELYLIAGKQGIHSHTMTQNIASMNAISREYDLERLWMAAADAEARGIADGDLVEMTSSEATGQVRVRVTERMRPGVVFMPSHYGGTSPYQTRACGFGLNTMDFVPFRMEPGVGSAMSQEVAVTVRKVEA